MSGSGADLLEVFVWYEADPADADRVRAAFVRLRDAERSAHVRAVHAPAARLMRRQDLRERDGVPRATWMEIWPHVPAQCLVRWTANLDAAALACGAAAIATSTRHLEAFVPADPG